MDILLIKILHYFLDDVEFDLQQDNVASKSHIPALWVLMLLHIAILTCLLLDTDVTGTISPPAY
jgi:hypothetical protein